MKDERRREDGEGEQPGRGGLVKGVHHHIRGESKVKKGGIFDFSISYIEEEKKKGRFDRFICPVLWYHHLQERDLSFLLVWASSN